MPSFDTDESVEFVSKELQSVKEPCIREMATNIDLMKENAHVAKNILDDESRSRRSPTHTTNSQKAIEQVPISGDQGQFFISFFFVHFNFSIHLKYETFLKLIFTMPKTQNFTSFG